MNNNRREQNQTQNDRQILENYHTDVRGHQRFLRDITIVRKLLQDHILRQDLTMEQLRDTDFTLANIPRSARNQAGNQQAILNIEFRENQLREILDLLNQLEGTIPMDMIGCEP